MDKFQTIVPKEEPVSDCDDDGVCLPVISSVREEFKMETEFKEECSSEEVNTRPGEFMEVEEDGLIISKIEVDEDLIQEKCDKDPEDPDSDDEKEILEDHQSLTHGDQSKSTTKGKSKLRECPICHEMKSQLSSHMKIHSAPDLKCKICRKMFRLRQDLIKHNRRVHLKEKPFKCSQCEKLFASKHELKQHLITHSSQKPFQCLNCGANFKWKQQFQQHLKLHDSDSNVVRRKCEICSRWVDNWDQHQRQHSGEEKAFPCKKCLKVYDTDKQLQIHARDFHVEDKESCRCPKCKKMFSTPSNMRVHLETVHSEEKAFPCSICDRKYKLKGHLKSHIKRVHGERK